MEVILCIQFKCLLYAVAGFCYSGCLSFAVVSIVQVDLSERCPLNKVNSPTNNNAAVKTVLVNSCTVIP